MAAVVAGPLAAQVVGAMGGPLAKIIGEAVAAAIGQAAVKPSVPLEPAQAPIVAQATMVELQKIPEFQHIASTETDWYQSRANWSSVISTVTAIAVPLLGIFGWKWGGIDPAQAAMLSAGLASAGGFIAAYLARRARTATKPLFAKEPDRTDLLLAQMAEMQRELARFRAVE